MGLPKRGSFLSRSESINLILVVIVVILILSSALPLSEFEKNKSDSQTTTGIFQSEMVQLERNTSLKSRDPKSDNPSTPSYRVTFTESRLPENTTWNLTIHTRYYSWSESSSNNSIYTFLANGTYYYTGHAWHNSTSMNENGNFTVAGSDLNLSIIFPFIFYNVTFLESGLPSGSIWSMDLFSSNITVESKASTDNKTLTLSMPNGTYYPSITTNLAEQGLSLSLYFQTVYVNGSNQYVPIIFPEIYNVSITVGGLKVNESWDIYLNGITASSLNYNLNYNVKGNSTEFQIGLPNGTYYYDLAFGIISLFRNNTTLFHVNGSTENVTVLFPALYKVTFNEQSLPSGATWYIYLGPASGPITISLSYSNHTSTNSMIAYLPDGSFQYQVTADYEELNDSIVIASSPLNLSVNNREENVSLFLLSDLSYLKFSPVRFVLDNVTLATGPDGLPDQWNVSVYGTLSEGGYNVTTSYSNHSVTGTMEAYLPNGNYTLRASYISCHSPPQAFHVNGTQEVVLLNFPFYPVTFDVPVIPTQSLWTVSVRGQDSSYFLATYNLTTTLYCPNGTYFYTAFTRNFSILQRSLTVDGSAVTIGLYFPFYTIVFNETGLPAGKGWTIIFNNSVCYTNSSRFVFVVTNGSYGYQILNVSGYTVSTKMGFVETLGGNSSLSVHFQQIKKVSPYAGLNDFIHSWYGMLSVVLIAVAIITASLLHGKFKRGRMTRNRP